MLDGAKQQAQVLMEENKNLQERLEQNTRPLEDSVIPESQERSTRKIDQTHFLDEEIKLLKEGKKRLEEEVNDLKAQVLRGKEETQKIEHENVNLLSKVMDQASVIKTSMVRNEVVMTPLGNEIQLNWYGI